MAKAGRLIYQGLLIAWDGFWVIWLSDLLWLVFCLPLVTAPLGFAGLYECAHGLAYGETISWRTFFTGIRRRWGTGYRWAVFNLAVFLLMAFYAVFFSGSKWTPTGLAASLLGSVSLVLIVFWWAFNQFTFPFMLVQEKPSYLNALRNSLVMFLKWPGMTLGFTLFNLAVIAGSLWLRIPWLILGASLPALMACLCVKYSVEQTLGAGPSREVEP
jgi:hypothetical protein